MSHDTKLFKLAIEYINNKGGQCQAEFLRNNLGESSNSSQVEFSKYCVASNLEWQGFAQTYREKGNKLKCTVGSYRDSVFKRALKIYDHQRLEEAKKAPAKRKSRGTEGDSTPARTEKKRKTPRKVFDNREEKEEEAVVPPDFKALNASLKSLSDGLAKAKAFHDNVSKALAAERKSGMALKKHVSSFEAQLDAVSESLEDECQVTDALKAENWALRKNLGQRAKHTGEVVRKCHTVKSLKTENARLLQELEDTKEMHEESSSNKTKALEEQRIANGQLQKRVADIREDLDALNAVHRQAAGSLAFQTTLLQEERKKRIMLEGKLESLVLQNHPEVATLESPLMSPTVGNSARRISM